MCQALPLLNFSLYCSFSRFVIFHFIDWEFCWYWLDYYVTMLGQTDKYIVTSVNITMCNKSKTFVRWFIVVATVFGYRRHVCFNSLQWIIGIYSYLCFLPFYIVKYDDFTCVTLYRSHFGAERVIILGIFMYKLLLDPIVKIPGWKHQHVYMYILVTGLLTFKHWW